MLFLHCRLIIIYCLYLSTNPNPKVCPYSHLITQSLKSRGEKDPAFWKEVATALVDQKHNTETARNGYQIPMFQGGSPYKLYFITIDNREQVIISPSKKIVATHVIGELEVLI